ncbi:MAG: PLP-dependent aminotransferase family protein [Candidatus Jordarchaeaceae archaeon]
MKKSFEHLFSNNATKLQASIIRELLKLTQKPEVISFAGGLPNPDAFPVQQIHEICPDIINNSNALQYGTTEGVVELREALKKRMAEKNVKCELENIQITSGSQQALDILGRILLNPNDIVLTTCPTYLGAIQAFSFQEPRYEVVEMDEHSVIVEDLETRLEEIHKRGEGEKLKFFYVTPTFHNPAGVTIPEKRRKEIIELCNTYDVLIVEDDPYSELRYRGKDEPLLKSLDTENRVVYISTFSKILVPGFRIAWMVAPVELVKKFVIAKQAVDLCTTPFTQYVAAEYLSRGYVNQHIKKIKEVYGRKMRIMLRSMEEYFPNGAQYAEPDGGMFVWVRLPEHINTIDLFPKAIAQNVAYVIGTAFYPNGGGLNTMRLNFTHPSDEKIEEGIKRLGKVLHQELSE